MKIMDLDKAYNKIDFINYLNDTLLPDFTLEERAVELDKNSIFTRMSHLGTSKEGDISIFEAVRALHNAIYVIK